MTKMLSASGGLRPPDPLTQNNWNGFEFQFQERALQQEYTEHATAAGERRR